MRSANWLVLGMAALLGYGVWQLFDLRFASGDLYPQYSSLRSDPQGTRALFETLERFSGFTAVRNYQPVEKLKPGKQVLFVLGYSPWEFQAEKPQELKTLEAMARSGTRIILGFTAQRAPKIIRDEKRGVAGPWELQFFALESAGHRESSIRIEPRSTEWHKRGEVLERSFGEGSIVLLPVAYPLSNEALETDRDTRLIAWLLRDYRRAMFDETHLGVVESGSIAGLAKRYRLQGVVAAMMLLTLLFFWKNSNPLLQPVETAQVLVVSAARDASTGLANLMRRSIPAKQLLALCFEQWEKSFKAGQITRGIRADRVARARQLALSTEEPKIVYAQISKVLSGRENR